MQRDERGGEDYVQMEEVAESERGSESRGGGQE